MDDGRFGFVYLDSGSSRSRALFGPGSFWPWVFSASCSFGPGPLWSRSFWPRLVSVLGRFDPGS